MDQDGFQIVNRRRKRRSSWGEIQPEVRAPWTFSEDKDQEPIRDGNSKDSQQEKISPKGQGNSREENPTVFFPKIKILYLLFLKKKSKYTIFWTFDSYSDDQEYHLLFYCKFFSRSQTFKTSKVLRKNYNF